MTRFANLWRLFALLPIFSLGGCHFLLLPCATGCSNWLISLPPQDNVLSLAMTRGTDQRHPEEALTATARLQYLALDRRWPSALDCDWLAQPGCRYTIAVQQFHRDGMRVDSGPCGLLDLAVEDHPDGPVVHKTGYRLVQCPIRRAPD